MADFPELGSNDIDGDEIAAASAADSDAAWRELSTFTNATQSDARSASRVVGEEGDEDDE